MTNKKFVHFAERDWTRVSKMMAFPSLLRRILGTTNSSLYMNEDETILNSSFSMRQSFPSRESYDIRDQEFLLAILNLSIWFLIQYKPNLIWNHILQSRETILYIYNSLTNQLCLGSKFNTFAQINNEVMNRDKWKINKGYFDLTKFALKNFFFLPLCTDYNFVKMIPLLTDPR